MPERGRRAFLARVVPIERGEWPLAALGFTWFFLLLGSYYLLRPLRDALAAAGGIGDLKWLFTATFVAMLLATPLYGALVARVPKRWLLPAVYLFFAADLLLFARAFHEGAASEWTAGLFFVWLSVFNLFVVSLFWSVLADVMPGTQARRLFGPVAAGGSLGAIVGPLGAHGLVGALGPAGLAIVAAGGIVATVPCMSALQRRVMPGAVVPAPAPIGGSAFAGITGLLRSHYLQVLALLVLLGSLAATFMYLELLRLAAEGFDAAAPRTRFFARIDLAVNVLALVVQVVLTPALVRRFGVTGGLLLLPAVAAGSFAWLAVVPVLATLAVTQVLRRALEYGAAKPVREMLFTAVDEETRFKAKNFLDTAVQRACDTSSAWLHGLLAAAGVALAGFAVLAIGLMALAALLSAWLAREFARLESAATAQSRDPGSAGGAASAHR